MEVKKPQAALKTSPSFGFFSMLRMRTDAFNMLKSLPLVSKDLVPFNVLGRKGCLIHQPEMIQHVLMKNHQNYVKDKGYEVLALLMGNGLITNPDTASWRKQRAMVQPAFHRESLRKISEIVTSSTETLLQKWRFREGQTINFTREMAWLTMDIVSKAIFTTDINDKQIEMVWKNLNYLNQMGADMARNPLHLPWQWPVPGYVKARKCISELDDFIYAIIRKRKSQGHGPHDLLQMLIDARYEDTGEQMSELQIRDEVMTTFVAGHETTVTALSWTWYLVKQHPEVEMLLKEESNKLAKLSTPSFEDLPQMKYGANVMNESMRVYPPVLAVGRKALSAENVCGFDILKDHTIGINISGMHHHPDYWDQPEVFRPERFDDFEIKGINRFIFMPFGAGPRICIGNSFAMMEMQLINAMLSARVEMELISRDVQPVPMITLKPGDGIIIKLKKIHSLK